MGEGNYISILEKGRLPDNYDDINYILYSNKDGNYDWRPFQIINPVIYISLINILSEKDNWNEILKRFKEIDKTSVIKCESIPVIEKEKEKNLNKQSSQISSWWEKIEQNSIKLSLEYNYLFKTDIINCYAEIYTHSIAWALHTKKVAKEKRNDKKLLGNNIDKHLRAMSNGQTNGIPQGSALMDFIAEILLKYSDELISCEIQKNTKLKEKFKILRYRDDYRIFVKEIETGREIMKIITKVLLSLGLKLNTTKTGYYDDIILSSIKEDKLEYLERKKESNLQKRLISLYKFSLKYKNSGSVIKEISQIREIIEKKKDFSKENVEVLISIITEIIYKNPRTYLDGNTILSYLFPLIKEKERKEIIEKVFKKLSKILNSGYFEIWFQRATLKEKLLNITYNEEICKLVNGKKIKLWNVEWIASKKIKDILKKVKIINQVRKEEMPQKISNEEVKIFDRYNEI
ncbi:RNA-directed DNA polymerase [Fusobacterium nucleatum]